jgi:hypothetical protein
LVISKQHKHKFHLYDYATLWVNRGLWCNYCKKMLKFSFGEMLILGISGLLPLLLYLSITFPFLSDIVGNNTRMDKTIVAPLIFILWALTGLVLNGIIYFKTIKWIIGRIRE